MTYAHKSSVPAEKTRGEIERTLARYGATGFAYGTETGRGELNQRGVVMPNGQTMAEHALPFIKDAYATGKMPPLLSFNG